MDVLKKYQIFFTLRDEYPEHKDLISELMSYLFKHNDIFSNMTYLNGNFDEKDIKFIFEKLNLSIVKRVIHSNLRSTKQTILELDIKCEPEHL